MRRKGFCVAGDHMHLLLWSGQFHLLREGSLWVCAHYFDVGSSDEVRLVVIEAPISSTGSMGEA